MARALNLVLMTIYVLIQNGGVIQKATYDGLSLDTVEQLLRANGKPYQIVSKEQFDLVKEDDSVAPPPSRTQAKALLLDRTKTVTQRLNALIEYLEVK
jgi:hypothetical protein